MNKATLTRSVGALCVFAAVGCAHNPPKELLDARAAYKQAAGGVAMQETPAQLHTADNALQLAEQTFKENGDSEHTRDLSYVAMRKAQIAEVQGRLQQNENQLKSLEAHATQAQGQELSKLRGQYNTQQQQLSASEAARKESEQRAAQAAADLARIASVKQDSRGTVITLSGEVLFTSGKAELLPAAQAKLSEVANALTQQNPDAKIVVEGHTDAQGSQTFNLDLSTRRAQAVRDYLASHGVAPDRITAQGLGFSRPLGDNKTAEGRANNRRVEIVVQPSSGGAQATAPHG
ncbi:MAG: outer membrane protein [Myxococcaceae bacterium]|nr:outer membrane protein [Myxococcaceae bacterium]